MNAKFKYPKEAKIGIVLSGGNIDVQMLNIIIEKGLIKSHRRMMIKVTLIDKPGALTSLTEIFKDKRSNIIKIDYDRFSTSIDYGDAQITITLETKGKAHQDSSLAELSAQGYKYENLVKE